MLQHLNGPNWTQYSRCVLTSAEYRGTITSLLLLATLFLIQARMLYQKYSHIGTLRLGHLGTLPAQVQLAVNQHPQVLFHQAVFQPLFPKPVALHEVVVTQVQDSALGVIEPYTADIGPLTQPVQIPLQSLPTIKQINTPTQLDVICKLSEGALDPLIQIIYKDIKQNWPQYRALGNTTCDRPTAGFNPTHHNSLGLAVQPVFYPAKCTAIQEYTHINGRQHKAEMTTIWVLSPVPLVSQQTSPVLWIQSGGDSIY